MRYLYISLLILYSVALLDMVFIKRGFSKNFNLTFSAGKCIPGPYIGRKINNTHWGERDFTLEATVSLNCAHDKVLGDYRIKNGILFLEYKPINILEDDDINCTCPVDLNYKVKNIAKKDYTVGIGPARDVPE